MLVNLYDKQSARLLAMATVANAIGPRARSTSSRARVIDIGGGWNTRSWRDSLRRLTDRGTVTALAARTQPNQRHLTDAEWEQVARRLARHAGLGQRPWLAVRTSPTTVAVLTDSTAGPPRMEDARRFIRSVTSGFGLKTDGTLTGNSDLEPRLVFSRPESERFPSPVAAPADGPDSVGGLAEAVVGREELTDKGLLAAVSMQWERMTASIDRGNRIATAANLAWNHTYSAAFEHGYDALSKAAAGQFGTLHQRLVDDPPRNPETVDCVRDLTAIARSAMCWRIETPEVPRQTMLVATRAGLERPENQTIPEAIVRAVCGEAAAIGGLRGAIAAANDIREGWKASNRSIELAIIDDKILQHIDAVFSDLHRELSEALAVREGSAGPVSTGMRSSFATPPGVQQPSSPDGERTPVAPPDLNNNRRMR
jgi:hypothetical protein